MRDAFQLDTASLPFKRRPVLALLLNGLTMGLGHLYLGQMQRALLFFSGIAAIQLALFVAVFLAPPSAKLDVFVPAFALLVAAHILGMIDAFRLARRLGSGVFDKRWFNRLSVYLAYCLLGALLSVSLTRMERRHLVNIYRISSSSMSPTLQTGDYVLTNQQFDCIDCRHSLVRGDIVVFELEGSVAVKRLVGMPGDQFQIENQVLSLNGLEAPRREIDDLGSEDLNSFHESSNLFEERLGPHTYRIAWDDLRGTSTETDDVSKEGIYLLGDNRDRSKDSREVGSIPLTSIRGRVDQIWLSKHRHGGWRAERSGLSFP